MKKSICLYFQVHQPNRLRLYRFFDIGKDSHYYDDFANRTILRRIAQKCYLPMNELLLELIKKNKGAFKVAFSITGSALEQFERYCPEVIDSFKALADTGKVEFLCETYSHALVSLTDDVNLFNYQVNRHKATIQKYFGVEPKTFRNTELIYSDAIGEMVYNLGFKAMLTEGAKHILGWKSPNFVYSSAYAPKLSLLLKNASLSDDIAFRFSDRGWSNWPLTGEKYLAWLKESAKNDDIVNLFMDYETFGEHQNANSGIFDFMRVLPEYILGDGTFEFVTPAEAAKKHKPVAVFDAPDAISWADEERDTSAWLGNELQNEAFGKLYALTEKLQLAGDDLLWDDFCNLQASDHFYYMCTKFFSDGAVHKMFNPYDTPFEAFINYMNVLSDFTLRVDETLKLMDEDAIKAAKERADEMIQKDLTGKKKAAAKKAPAKKAPAKKAAEKAVAPAKKAAEKKVASAKKAAPKKAAAAKKK